MGIAFMAVVTLLALAYMVAAFLQDDRLRAWVVRELGQLVYSALIVIFVLALVGSLDSWLKVLSLTGSTAWQTYVNAGVCCPPDSGQCALPPHSNPRGRACHIEIATDYLQILYETARQSAATYLNNYGMFAFLSHLSFSASIVMKFMAGLTFYPFAGLEMIAEFFSLLFDLSIKTMMLLRAQQMFLDFLWYPLFPIMIALGLTLRILYFTRKLGGTLIALALALYIVFPMFYVLTNGILFGFMHHTAGGNWDFGSTYDSNPVTGTPLPADTQVKPAQRAKNIFSDPALAMQLCGDPPSEDQTAMSTAMETISGDFGKYDNGQWYSQTLVFVTGKAFKEDGPIANLALLMVFTLFIPFLALMTTLAAFKALSPLIGGDAEISLLSRLI
jgi:hypothetical protein